MSFTTTQRKTTTVSSTVERIIEIQAWFRGVMSRKKRLPNILCRIQKDLQEEGIKLCTITGQDGRTESCIDETIIIKWLQEKEEYGSRIFKSVPKHWTDMVVYDFQYGLLPVNIKTTTMKTCDNTGNLAMCVYAYTDEVLDLKTKYNNGSMSEILVDKFKKKEYNQNDKKDYYFLVVNKKNPTDVVINSVKGLTTLNPNSNNLPFQVKWNKNQEFCYKPIEEVIELYRKTMRRTTPSWKEKFLKNARNF